MKCRRECVHIYVREIRAGQFRRRVLNEIGRLGETTLGRQKSGRLQRCVGQHVEQQSGGRFRVGDPLHGPLMLLGIAGEMRPLGRIHAQRMADDLANPVERRLLVRRSGWRIAGKMHIVCAFDVDFGLLGMAGFV